MKVEKRTKQIVDFDKTRISDAILKAMKAGNTISVEVANKVADEIEQEANASGKDYISISEIENMVFYKLIANGHALTAKAYEGYRKIREFQRQNKNTTDEQMKEMLDGQNEYWKNENSNKNACLVTTKRDYMAGIISKDLARRYLLPPDVVQANDLGIIKVHDMDYFAQHLTNCNLINLDDMFRNGTVVNGVAIDPQHKISTAMTVATQIITAVTSSQYGGTTISLTHLAPYVRSSYERYVERYRNRGLSEDMVMKFAKEDLEREVKDAVQTFNYQINSMNNSNGQSPFVSVFMYLGETDEYKKELAMLIEEFLHQRMQGLKNKKGQYITQAFPKLLYVLEKDNITEDSPYWYLTELSARCTAKRMVPDYISEKIMLELKGDVYPCMGCRSFLTPDRTTENVANDGVYKKGHKYYGRFNIGVVTINLVDAALSSNGDMENFWKILDERAELCHKAHLARTEHIGNTISDEAPIMWQDGALARLKPGEKVKKLFYGGYATCSLGYAGLYECVKYMTGKSHTDGGDGEAFGLKVMQFLNDKCAEWKKAENIDYSIYGTPMESGTYQFAKSLQKRFGKVEGITDRNYITNSYHYWVKEKVDAYTKLTTEAKFQSLSPGGAISYVECGDLTHNIPAVLSLIKHIYNTIMYAELNIKSDCCQKCGYEGEIEIIDKDGRLSWRCPNCGNEDQESMNVARRTCGYIGVNKWNQGRTQEIKERYVHMDDQAISDFDEDEDPEKEEAKTEIQPLANRTKSEEDVKNIPVTQRIQTNEHVEEELKIAV